MYFTGGITDYDMIRGRELCLLGPSCDLLDRTPGVRDFRVDAMLVMDALVTGRVAELPDSLAGLLPGMPRK